jgi:CheY-like chemotaxis protein
LPKILIVEDEGITVLHLKKSLERLGYDIAGVAASGDNAIMKAAELRPDLILMDIGLRSGIDGIDAAEKIGTILKIPVVYLTAHADDSTLQRAKGTDAFGYIVKPFKERDLHIAIEFALHKAKGEAERNHLVTKLRDALSRIETLSEERLLCSTCKKMNRDADEQEQGEDDSSAYEAT